MSAPTTVVETVYVPTCPGNSADGGVALCGAALSGCPTAGDVRHWVYTRTVDMTTGAPITGWRRTANPPFVCLGAGDPGIDPRVAVVGLVRAEFKDFPLEKGVVRTRPVGETLVGAPTELTTTADGTDVITRTILGLPVVVTAKAQSFVWHFGDGTSQTVPDASVLHHVYRRTGPLQPSVDVVYGGTFTVGGAPTVYDVQGTATAVGSTTTLVVREARSQLEAGPAG